MAFILPNLEIMNAKNFLTTLAVLVGVAATANAQVSYTNLASFLGASGGLTLFDFEGIAGSGLIATNPSLSPLGVNILNGNDANFYVYDATAGFGAFSLNGSASLVAGNANVSLPSVTLTLGGSYTAFGTNIGFRGGAGLVNNGFTAKLYNGVTQVGSSYLSGPLSSDFIGFTSSTGFDRVELTSDNLDFSYQTYDNVRVGTALAVTPEAPALVQVIPGLLPIAWVIRNRRRAKKSAA